MWDDHRQLNAASLTIAIIAAVSLAWAALAWLVRQPMFALREVVVMTPLKHANGAHIESVVREELAGTFFTLDLDRASRALAQVPWVRAVALRRQWPRRLEIDVVEHQPLARWNDSGLVDTRGEVFVADFDGHLPQFDGPDGQSPLVTARYREWSTMLAPIGLSIRALKLTARGAWEVATASDRGALKIEIGRDDATMRLARFVAAHDRTVAAIARAGRRIEQVDLRYRNGFAVRVPDFREKPTKRS